MTYPWSPRTPPPAAPVRRSGATYVGAAVGAVWASALATQYVAGRLAYHPHLGPWLYRAPETDRHRLQLAVATCATAAAMALACRSRRWAAVPLALAAVSAAIVRNAPIYSPARIFVWYGAYRTIRPYRELFVTAWVVFGITLLAVALAAARLTHPHLGSVPAPPPLDRRSGDHTIN